jgi:hypothetical protein
MYILIFLPSLFIRSYNLFLETASLLACTLALQLQQNVWIERSIVVYFRVSK